MLHQIDKRFIAQAVFIRPLRITEYAKERVRISLFDLTHSFLNSHANTLGVLTRMLPMRSLWNLETVILGKFSKLQVSTGFFQRVLVFLIVNIADTLIEQKRKYVLLIISGIDQAAQ